MRALLVAILAAGCHALSGDSCPASPPTDTVVECNTASVTCTYGGTTCSPCADSSKWVCGTDTCPWDLGTNVAPCTTDPNEPSILRCPCGSADTTCDVSGFEADCSCSCADFPQGRFWSCVNGLPRGFSRACPVPPADAGVVD